IPGRIQVTERVVQVTSDDFEFEDRGILEVKGRGKMRTYLLEDNMRFQKVNKNREHFIETYYH
ncbi:MAG: adenylate/guanylate cyclase domain-containing protein, partial [Bdellovibrionota bacterium]|nr:adenylate/guanylate cyclase domain-containing protein [Bdellovibrionota bacterium]